MITELGQICSDIGQPEIIDINDCKEAHALLGVPQFIDKSYEPDPKVPRGCYWDCLGDCEGHGDLAVVWNPVEKGQPDSLINAICLNSGKYILVFLSHKVQIDN